MFLTSDIPTTQRSAALLLAFAGLIGVAGCSGSDDGAMDDTSGTDVAVAPADAVAYDYFGSVEIAQGSTLEIVVQNVVSSADVTLADVPAGVNATVSEADDGSTRLEIEVADDAQLGTQTITFEIAGETDPVNWTIDILSR